jgi:hypothetical protein
VLFFPLGCARSRHFPFCFCGRRKESVFSFATARSRGHPRLCSSRRFSVAPGHFCRESEAAFSSGLTRLRPSLGSEACHLFYAAQACSPFHFCHRRFRGLPLKNSFRVSESRSLGSFSPHYLARVTRPAPARFSAVPIPVEQISRSTFPLRASRPCFGADSATQVVDPVCCSRRRLHFGSEHAVFGLEILPGLGF